MRALTTQENFKAKAGTSAKVDFAGHGAKFSVPAGEITKNGESFSGAVKFEAAVVHPKTDGLAGVPPLDGRGRSGDQVSG